MVRYHGRTMDVDRLLQEITFKTARSSGAGGQHVNKVESKVILLWDVTNSSSFTPQEKTLIRERLAHRITKEGILQMEDSSSRSQLSNKELVTSRFVDLVKTALRPTKKRIPTKTPKSTILKRLDRKKRQSQKKQQRKKKFGFE